MKYITRNPEKILYVAVDSEYTNSDFLSLQVSIRDEETILTKGFFVNSKFLNDELYEKCSEYCENSNIEFIPVEYKDSEMMIIPFLESTLQTFYPDLIEQGYSFKFYYLFFYSPKDIWYAFGFNYTAKYFKSEIKRNTRDFIIQKRSIFGSFSIVKEFTNYKIRIKLRDLKGYTNRSLKHLASSLNIKMEDKNLMDFYKERMDLGFQNDPINFIKYSMNDVDVLHKIYMKQLKNINFILFNYLGIPKYLHFHERDIPVSTGKLVSSIFEKFMLFKLSGSPKYYYQFLSKKEYLKNKICRIFKYNYFA